MPVHIPHTKNNDLPVCKGQLWSTCKSISKNDGKGELPNEDASLISSKRIGIADGAGGVGLYAREWANYLLISLPDKPLASVTDLNEFLRNHWKLFFEKYKTKAEEKGNGNKFLTEGSSATLISVWMDDHRPGFIQWIAVGDSALLIYNIDTHKLKPINISLNTFLNPPFLINWKAALNEDGFKSGSFFLHPDEVLLFATDALAQYIMLSYALCSKVNSTESIQNLSNIMASSNRINTIIENMKRKNYPNLNFHQDVMVPLLLSLGSISHFRKQTNKLLANGLIDIDDYTLLTLHS